MIALLLIVVAALIAAGVGRELVGRATRLRWSPLERAVYATTIGLGLASYGVYLLGLCGGLSIAPVTAWWVLLGLAGAPGTAANFKDAAVAVRAFRPAVPRDRPHWIAAVATMILILVAVCGVILCFRPPGGHEWDALAYHLADPKLYLLGHRVAPLPTEHHSNFPFTIEMLFAVGLLYVGYPLANLFHLLTGVLTVLALIAWGRRALSPSAGWIAAVIFSTTPLALWEATSAYIDVAYGLFATLGLLAALDAARTEGEARRHWTMLAGVMVGFALGTKYLGVMPFALALLYLVGRRSGWRTAVAFVSIALVIGGPWYVKNAVLMRNPVYPFAYSLFPHSMYWSRDRAVAYQQQQDSFGFSHSLRRPSEAALNLVLTPLRLVTKADKFADPGDFTVSVLIGGLYAGFCFALAFVKGAPKRIVELFVFGLIQTVGWFFAGQISRYLVSVLPVFALVSGYVAARAVGEPIERDDPEDAPASPAVRCGLVGYIAGAAVLGQTALLFLSLFATPTKTREAIAKGVMPTAESIGETLEMLGRPDGASEWLGVHLDVYSAESWINANTPAADGVVLYDENRGFYLDRAYVWGNGLHSTFIPYDRWQSGRQLTEWLGARGIRYALINLNWSPQRISEPDLPRQDAELAYRRWYVDAGSSGERWRALLGDALRRDAWAPVYFSPTGVVVVRIGAGGQAASRALSARNDRT